MSIKGPIQYASFSPSRRCNNILGSVLVLTLIIVSLSTFYTFGSNAPTVIEQYSVTTTTVQKNIPTDSYTEDFAKKPEGDWKKPDHRPILGDKKPQAASSAPAKSTAANSIENLKDHNSLSTADFSNKIQNKKFDNYETSETWRPPIDQADKSETSQYRYSLPGLEKYKTKADYLQQPLVADYANGSDRVFFMIKTGGSVLWKRLPIHLMTSLTRVPNFALYSDSPGSVGGHEVIDILKNSSQSALESREFELYRYQKAIHDKHGVIDYSDINLGQGWDLDKFKNIPMLADAYSRSPNSDWYVFMDADSYFMMDNLMDWLNTLDPNTPYYFGSRAMVGSTPFAHGGSGVVLSHRAVEETVGKHPEYVQEYEKKTFSQCCGDFMVAVMLKEKLGLEISAGAEYPGVSYKFQGNNFWDVMVTEEKWCQPIVSFHHLTPHDIEILWEYEKLKGPVANRPLITYGDIYRDFYLPYIVEELKDWDNKAKGKEFSLDKDNKKKEETQRKAEEQKNEKSAEPVKIYEFDPNDRPYTSLEACKKACDDMKSCNMYRYLPLESYCGLSEHIKLGKPSLKWVNDDYHTIGNNKEAVSGWRIDRIREIRKRQSCDPLNDKKEEPKEEKEGWFRQNHIIS